MLEGTLQGFICDLRMFRPYLRYFLYILYPQIAYSSLREGTMFSSTDSKYKHRIDQEKK